jgi:hypothetical protein
LFARGQLLTLAVQKLKNRNATKNDIFQFDLQVESACALSDLNGLGRITSSIAIELLCVFTQPRPTAVALGQQLKLANWVAKRTFTAPIR